MYMIEGKKKTGGESRGVHIFLPPCFFQIE